MLDSSGPRIAANLPEILREARIAAGRTQREAATALGSSLSKISRLEGGRRKVTPLVAYTLLRFYDYPRELASKISGHEVAGHPPLEAFDAGIPPWLRPFLEYEGTSELIEHYQRDLIPGVLLHPGEDAASLLTYGLPGAAQVQVGLEGELQTRRLARFLTGSTRMHVVIEESALLRHLTAAGTGAGAHIDHMLAMAAHERVHLLVLPTSAGLVATMSTTFAAFTMPAGIRPGWAVSVSHAPGTVTYMSVHESYLMYRKLFADLAASALDAAGSVELIGSLRGRWG